MPHSLAVLDSVRDSGLPHSEKTAIRRFYDRLAPIGHRASSMAASVGSSASSMAASVGSKLGLGHHTVVSGTRVLRAGGEALIVGGAIGALDAQLGGLDVNVPVGGGFSVPVDGAAGVLAYGASMVQALDGVSEDLERVGTIGVASWAARQAKTWVAAKKSAPASSTNGEFGEDAVLKWAASQ